MTRRAAYDGIVRYSLSDNASDEAIDAQQSRTLINNASHYAEEDGQVLIAYPGHTYGSYSASFTTSSITNVVSFGPFHLRLKPNRSTYKIRVRMYGLYGTNTCKVWVVVAPRALAPLYAVSGAVNGVYGNPTASAAWIDTYDTNGTASTIIEYARANPDEEHQTYDELGGNETSAKFFTTDISVLVQGVSGSGTFGLYQLYAAETFGA